MELPENEQTKLLFGDWRIGEAFKHISFNTTNTTDKVWRFEWRLPEHETAEFKLKP